MSYIFPLLRLTEHQRWNIISCTYLMLTEKVNKLGFQGLIHCIYILDAMGNFWGEDLLVATYLLILYHTFTTNRKPEQPHVPTNYEIVEISNRIRFPPTLSHKQKEKRRRSCRCWFNLPLFRDVNIETTQWTIELTHNMLLTGLLWPLSLPRYSPASSAC